MNKHITLSLIRLRLWNPRTFRVGCTSKLYKAGTCCVNGHDKHDSTGSRSFSSSSSAPTSSSSSSSVPVLPTPTNDKNTSTSLSLINFDTSSAIQGEESQILQVHLEPHQILRAESGAMLFMTQGVEMSTSLSGTSTGTSTGTASTTTSNSNALSDGFKRMLTGQNLFISEYTYHGPSGSKGTVALGTDFPSKIIRFTLKEYDYKIICQKSAYLASDVTVDIQLEFAKKFTAGFFGGEGFILQGLTGDGDVFVKAGGTVVKKELQHGETLRISSGSLVAFTKDVEFDVQMMPGFKNVMFGGEGLFITTLTGPGTVWLQGMPPDRMISEITRRVPSGSGIGLGIPIGMGAGGGESESESGEGQDEAGTGTEDSGNLGGEDLVASTDTAVEADRNATIASSGFNSTDTGGDSESSSALFGDVAPSSSTTSSDARETNNSQDTFTSDFGADTDNAFLNDDSSSSSISSNIPNTEEDSTIFSNEDNMNFNDDLTNKQFDDFHDDETVFSSEEGQSSDDNDIASSGEEGGNSVIDTLWNIFFHDDE